jgi:ankyrin repeat protein
MDIVNIINNFDQSVLMENILITNQIKLLDLVIELFETKLKDKDLNVDLVTNYLNDEKFLNWELFIRLINLKSQFFYKNRQYKSLFYLVEKKSFKLLSFLLDLDEKIIYWDNKIRFSQNIFHLVFTKLYKNDDLILKIINNYSKFNNLLNQIDINNKSPLNYFISNCSESLILESLDKMIINLDYVDLFGNTLVHLAIKRNFIKLMKFLIEKNVNLNISNLGGRRPIHLSCIKNNLDMTKLLVENKVDLDIFDKEFLKPIDYAIIKGNLELISYLIDNNIELDDEIMNKVVQNQDKKTIEYIFNNKLINLSKTEFLSTAFYLLCKGCFYQLYKLSLYKFDCSIIDFINNPNYYYDGKYIGDIFENKDD